jgi:prepilin-type N-terminal cleavage/methylation domain-containing protein
VRARTDDQGFTLLELSIVLVIIAIVTGMAIQSGVSVVATARLSATQQKLKAVDQALLAYRNANDRLPCPADLTKAPGAANYGVEGANPGACTGGTPAATFRANASLNGSYLGVVEGAVPVTTLGLPNDFMYDGWGNHIRYAVNMDMTGLDAFALILPPSVCAALTVNDVNGVARSTGAIYALISQGPNGHGAYSKNGKIISTGSVNANEQKNCHCNSSGTLTTYGASGWVTYVQADPSLDPSNSLDSFDDIVMYKEYWQTQSSNYLLPPMGYRVYATDVYDEVRIFNAGGNNYYQGGFGSVGYTGNGHFNGPTHIAFDSSNNIWVGSGEYWIEKFNSSGSFISQIGGYGFANGNLLTPWGFAFDATGNIWIADTRNNRVQEFTSGGSWIQTIPSSGCGNITPAGCTASTTNGQFNNPKGVAFDSSGNLWVTDYGNNRVQEFNSSGSYLFAIGAGYNGVAGAIGSTGTASGQFNGPLGIAIDSSNNIWVVDSSNNRVQEFNSSGSFLNGIGAGYNGVAGTIGTASTYYGAFSYPSDIVVTPNGLIWVVATNSDRISIFNTSLQYTCGVRGYNLDLPNGIAVSLTR